MSVRGAREMFTAFEGSDDEPEVAAVPWITSPSECAKRLATCDAEKNGQAAEPRDDQVASLGSSFSLQGDVDWKAPTLSGNYKLSSDKMLMPNASLTPRATVRAAPGFESSADEPRRRFTFPKTTQRHSAATNEPLQKTDSASVQHLGLEPPETDENSSVRASSGILQLHHTSVETVDPQLKDAMSVLLKLGKAGTSVSTCQGRSSQSDIIDETQFSTNGCVDKLKGLEMLDVDSSTRYVEQHCTEPEPGPEPDVYKSPSAVLQSDPQRSSIAADALPFFSTNHLVSASREGRAQARHSGKIERRKSKRESERVKWYLQTAWNSSMG
jgi:hypothetical protein